MKAIKSMMSALVLVMALALVSSGNSGVSSDAQYGSTKDADHSANVTDSAPYAYGAEPAYVDYIGARPVPYSEKAKSRSVPDPMGSWN